MKYRIRIEPAGVEIECDAGQSLLDAALAQGYFPHHSCRRGECGACRVQLLSGEVGYAPGRRPDGAAALAADECLSCQAVPRSDVAIRAPEVLAEPGRRVVQASARVLEVERVCHDVAVVRLQLPASAGFQFKAGQYADVILRDGSRRSYSMANPPNADGLIEWHVRAMPGGRFSPHVYERLKLRDLLRVEGPFGAFGLAESEAPVVLLASGTGFAPIAAMLRSQADALARRGAVLYWGGRRLEDLYAREEAEHWAQRHPGCRFVPVLSDPAPGWHGRTGFVHEAVVADIPDLAGHEVYACGNPLMVDAARTVYCQDHGLPPARFHSDAFVTRCEPREAAQAA